MTQQQIDNIIERYPYTSTAALAAEFGLTIGGIYWIASRYGVKKTREYITETAKEAWRNGIHPAMRTQFKKGHIPANKGKNGAEYLSDESRKRMSKTQFKKGGIPHNHKEVGWERVSKDGYIEVKVAEPRTFRSKHRIIWEEANGPVAKGYNIQFKDGNRLNCTIENLYIISRSEQLRTENTLWARYPPEVQSAILAKAALTRQINKRLKEDNDE